MRISEGLLEVIEEALPDAKRLSIPVLIDGTSPERGWPCWVVYPDGTISLLSRDENEVVEARMSLELAR